MTDAPFSDRTRAAARRLTALWHSGPAAGEDRLFPLLAVLIGALAGLSVVCFRVAIDWSRVLLLGSSLAPGWPRAVLVPAGAGLVVAILVRHVFPRVRGSGVNQTKAALFIYDGYVPFNTVIGKFLTCALGIGSGQSLGPEDPSLQIGAGIASALGRGLRLSRQRLRLIAPIGAAAGLGAAFNAPIAAVLFVIEEVIGAWSAGVLGAVVLSSVSSVVVMRWFLGDAPMFGVPPYHLAHPRELIGYVVLGAVGGLASLAFIKLMIGLRVTARRLPAWTVYALPSAAGLVVGTVGVWYPQVMGAGYMFIEQALHDQYAWRALFIIAGLKILTTATSFASGTPGGLFAPTLFIGAMIGAGVGAAARLSPFAFETSVGAYALVGMGTLFAGIIRTPMTSAIMILEVSGSYSIILPVMISNAIAYFISRRFQPTPVFDLLTRQEGLELPSMEELREARSWRVEDAMRVHRGPLLSAEDSVGDAARRVEGFDGAWILVRTGKTYGVVTREDVEQRSAERDPHRSLGTLVSPLPVPYVHADQSLELALRLLLGPVEAGDALGPRDDSGPPLLPVVHRADFAQVIGVIGLADVLQAYARRPKAED